MPLECMLKRSLCWLLLYAGWLHPVCSMALGFLFLGAGTLTFGTSLEAGQDWQDVSLQAIRFRHINVELIDVVRADTICLSLQSRR